jgi:hypothetical protein
MVGLCGVGRPLSLPRPPAALHDTPLKHEMQECLKTFPPH